MLSQNKTLVLALDADAYGKAIESADAFKFYLDKNLRIARLDKDLKYETDSHIKDLVMAAIKD